MDGERDESIVWWINEWASGWDKWLVNVWWMNEGSIDGWMD